MNQAPSQFRLEDRRCRPDDRPYACRPSSAILSAASAICALWSLPVNPLQLPLRDGNRAFHVLAAGAVVGEHVENDEICDGGRGFLADRTQSAGGERAFGGIAERRA